LISDELGSMSSRLHQIDACLVVGGKWHDFDFARLELLTLTAEHPNLRVTVLADYEDTHRICAAQLLISYTCNVRPTERAQQQIRTWVEQGGRWVALHGTNSALDLPPQLGVGNVVSPRVFPLWADTLGSQFIAHPPIAPYLVEITDPAHWLVAGLEPFETDDELYLSDYPNLSALTPLLHTTWSGEATGFAEADWSEATRGTQRHLVSYLQPLGSGAVLYNTLGHCRGHYDMVPLLAYYPLVERGSWTTPQYYELLRRALRWGLALTL
jgi:uncharacterized protein